MPSRTRPLRIADWRRRGPGLAREVIDLPEQLRSQLLSLTGSCHLSFTAIDVVLDTSGQYISLEINPSGEWGWPERVTGLDIEPGSQAPDVKLPL